MISIDHSPLIAAHLDFKGVQFRPEYFPQLFRDLAGQRINAVVVEYEDVFPFDGIDIAFDKETRWTSAMLEQFLMEARANKVEVIPLQQCLGHLEYLFRWNRYRDYAVDPAYPSTLHIDKPEAVELVFEMLRQVIAAHPESRYIHLGMDEARSLITYAAGQQRDPLDLFLGHLEALCRICEEHGKTPIVWSDMFEDHLNEHNLELLRAFKERIVLCPWDYFSREERIPVGRIAGFRVSKKWLEHPEDEASPPITTGMDWIEETPPVIREIIAPYLDETSFLSMFQADMWSSLGFRVLGASGARISHDRSIVPHYHIRFGNIRAWSRAVARTGILGQLATSWARGNSFVPPNLLFDLTWPQLGEMARTMGEEPEPFFAGIDQQTLERILLSIGRCRVDWNIEESLLRELEELEPQVQSHQYEWKSLTLMLRLWMARRRADEVHDEVEYFRAGLRVIDSEWQRRLHDQDEIIGRLEQLRGEVRAHFSQRYYGEAFEEWLRQLFNLPLAQLKEVRELSAQQALASVALYN